MVLFSAPLYWDQIKCAKFYFGKYETLFELTLAPFQLQWPDIVSARCSISHDISDAKLARLKIIVWTVLDVC